MSFPSSSAVSKSLANNTDTYVSLLNIMKSLYWSTDTGITSYNASWLKSYSFFSS